MLVAIHVMQCGGDELPKVADMDLFGKGDVVFMDEGFFAGVRGAMFRFFGDGGRVLELGRLALFLGIGGVAVAARGGDVFVGDLDVVDEHVAEIDGCGKTGAGDHLIIDEEHHMVGAGWQVDGRGKSTAILPTAL